MKRFFAIILLLLSINAFSQVPTVGLVAYYPFSGNANDMSGHGYNGIVHGASLIMDRFGNLNSAYSFNGTSDYIDLSSHVTNLNFQQPASISFWINTKYDQGMAVYSIDDGNNGQYISVIYIGDNVTNTLTNELIVAFNESTLTDFYIVGFTTTNRSLLMASGWHHIAIIYNGIITTCYLDNSLVSLTCGTGTNNGHYGNLNTAATAYIGARYVYGVGSFFHGWLDDIRIYNVALNSAQVDSLYHETPTSIENLSVKSNTIDVYPNPASGKLNIRCNFDFKTMEIINMHGETIYHSSSNNFIANHELFLPCVSNGVYLVRIYDGKLFYNKKIVIY